MRFVIGCLALVGLVVILAVGGCFAVAVMVVKSMPSIPEGLTKSAVEQRYQDSLTLVRRSIEREQMSSLREDPRVLAVYRTSSDKEVDLYLREPSMKKTGHSLWNGAGIAEMTAGPHESICVAYDLKNGGRVYLVVLRNDAGLIPPVESPVEAPIKAPK